MFITHDRRGGHGHVARNLMIAVATAALAGSGVAIAADGGAAPVSTNAPAGCVEPAKTAHKTGERAPLAEDEQVVTEARARLEGLVAQGAIDQAEADEVMRGVIAGSVDPEALVRAGDVSAAHMRTINNVLREVKQANAPRNGVEAGDIKQAAAVKRDKLAAGG
jgi:hypothetical protein